MSHPRHHLVLTVAAGLFATGLWAPDVLAQQGGVVAGTVVRSGTLTPIEGAQIAVEGTRLGTTTDASGRFRIANVAGERARLQIRRISFTPTTQEVRVGDTEVRIVLGDEAQLIVAEIDAGNVATAANAVAIVNNLRARAGLPAYTGGITPAEVQALVREERRRELFLEGQRLGDIVRFNITLSPAAGTAYKAGGVYGSDVGSQACFPLPDVEKNNNPNF